MVIEVFEDSEECTIAVENLIRDININRTLNRVIIANDNNQGEFKGWMLD